MDICVVIVTFNRKQDLEKTLALYETQTMAPRCILVVDNHSTDGTSEMLSATYIRSAETNLRFSASEKIALRVFFSILKPSTAEKRSARSIRNASSVKR